MRNVRSQIKRVVAEEFEVEFKLLADPTRVRQVVEARKVYAMLMRKHTKKSLRYIGEGINRDHATVLHSINAGNDFYKYDKLFKMNYDNCEREISKLNL